MFGAWGMVWQRGDKVEWEGSNFQQVQSSFDSIDVFPFPTLTSSPRKRGAKWEGREFIGGRWEKAIVLSWRNSTAVAPMVWMLAARNFSLPFCRGQTQEYWLLVKPRSIRNTFLRDLTLMWYTGVSVQLCKARKRGTRELRPSSPLCLGSQSSALQPHWWSTVPVG